MNAAKTLMLSLVAAPLAVPGVVFASCSQSTDITNTGNGTLRIVELKSSYAWPVFRSQWTGLRVIAPGQTATINWTSDLDCLDGFGDPNVWIVRLIRQNGATHECADLVQNQPVEIETPERCYPQ